MDIKHLKILVEIVRCHSFSAAAEHLFLTQPSISKAVSALEDELGVALFQKGEGNRKRDSDLTYIGELIYRHAQAVLAEQQKIYDTVAQVGSLKKGRLILGLSPLGSVLLSGMIALFHERFPDIQLVFLEVGANEIAKALADKSIDVGILLGNVHPDFAAIPIQSSPLYLVSRHDSAFARRAQVALAELREQAFLLYADSFTLNSVIIQAARSVGFEPKIVCKSSQWDFIVKMVAGNMGITLLPQVYCRQLPPEQYGISRLVEPQLNWTLNMAWNTTVAMSPATEAWLDLIKQHPEQIHL